MAAAAVQRGRFEEDPAEADHHLLPKFSKTYSEYPASFVPVRSAKLLSPPLKRYLYRQDKAAWTLARHPLVDRKYFGEKFFDEMVLEWFTTDNKTLDVSRATQVLISFRWGHCVASATAEFRPVRHLDEGGVERIVRVDLSVSRQDIDATDTMPGDLIMRLHSSTTSTPTGRRLLHHRPVRLCDMRYIVTDLLLYHPNCAMAIFTWVRKAQCDAWKRNGRWGYAAVCERQPWKSQPENTVCMYYGGETTPDYWKRLHAAAPLRTHVIYMK